MSFRFCPIRISGGVILLLGFEPSKLFELIAHGRDGRRTRRMSDKNVRPTWMVGYVHDNEFGGVDAGSISQEEIREGGGAAAADIAAGRVRAGCAAGREFRVPGEHHRAGGMDAAHLSELFLPDHVPGASGPGAAADIALRDVWHHPYQEHVDAEESAGGADWVCAVYCFIDRAGDGRSADAGGG